MCGKAHSYDEKKLHVAVEEQAGSDRAAFEAEAMMEATAP
jgi:hypothetical protein